MIEQIRTTARVRTTAWPALTLLLFGSAVRAQLGSEIASPGPLTAISLTDNAEDAFVQVATDGAGHWVAVWHSNNRFLQANGTDRDILFSRSADNGQSWTLAAVLNDNAAIDRGDDQYPQIVTGGSGTWVAVWESNDTQNGAIGTDLDVLFARSTNNGASWTTPLRLNSNANADVGMDERPHLDTDGSMVWIAAWSSDEPLGGSGRDADIFLARSVNDGQTWSAPAALNENANIDVGDDELPQLVTDASGNWLAVWQSNDSLNQTIGGDLDILFAVSADNGLTWTQPAPLNNNAGVDTGDDMAPTLATDGGGNWIAVWYSNDSLFGTIGTDPDVLFAVSDDNGAGWTNPAALNRNAGSDLGSDVLPRIRADALGNWAVVWQSNDPLIGAAGPDLDVFISRSANNGATWTVPAVLNKNAALDQGSDQSPTLETNGAGQWVAAWHANKGLEGLLGDDFDILVADFELPANGAGPGPCGPLGMAFFPLTLLGYLGCRLASARRRLIPIRPRG